MKLYTRTGDDGSTALFGGGRTSKASARVAAYGTVDELNAVLGLARALGDADALDVVLGRLQGQLLALGADLATPAGVAAEARVRRFEESDVTGLEAEIDAADAELPPLRAFVLPAGAPRAAALHQARAVCRRAERLLVPLAEAGEVRPPVLAWVNRLSDLLFALARLANHRAGVGDVTWGGGALP